MLEVPGSFVVEVVRQRGEVGRRWLTDLPAVVEELCAGWRLDVSNEPVRHGANAIVVPVERAGHQLVLKVSWHTSSVDEEVAALRAWGGHGAVELFDADPRSGAVLLERLDARTTLRGVDIYAAGRNRR